MTTQTAQPWYITHSHESPGFTAENQGFITDTIDAINNLPNVLSTVLVYHQIETDIDDPDKNTGTQNSQLEGEV